MSALTTLLLVAVGYALVALVVGVETYAHAARSHGSWRTVADEAADRFGAWIVGLFWPVALVAWPIRRYARWRAGL